jgi:hypothetical protein
MLGGRWWVQNSSGEEAPYDALFGCQGPILPFREWRGHADATDARSPNTSYNAFALAQHGNRERRVSARMAPGAEARDRGREGWAMPGRY